MFHHVKSHNAGLSQKECKKQFGNIAVHEKHGEMDALIEHDGQYDKLRLISRRNEPKDHAYKFIAIYSVNMHMKVGGKTELVPSNVAIVGLKNVAEGVGWNKYCHTSITVRRRH